MLRVLGCIGLLLCAAPAAAAPVSFAVDPSATRIGFEVGAKGYPVTKGMFRSFSADLDIDFDMPARSKVMFRVGSNSLDTQAPVLDDYVRGPGFLDSARYPDITFVSTRVRKLDDKTVEVVGNLTLLGVTREEAFDVNVAQHRAGSRDGFAFQVVGAIHRSDFGMTGGLPLVSDDVRITVYAQAAAR
ncbi:YceI family protein [Roseixanthobacter glucoisosaccharinicivorans]|uniref:YceI family protein n=1 Tax=Roseixanthobacter glucoisosaccharinicivorans TaxID=3119923 RepID=UPI00372AE29D